MKKKQKKEEDAELRNDVELLEWYIAHAEFASSKTYPGKHSMKPNKDEMEQSKAAPMN